MLRLKCTPTSRHSGLLPILLVLSTTLARELSFHHIHLPWDLGHPCRPYLLDNSPHIWFPFPMVRQNNRHCRALLHMKLVAQYISTMLHKCLLTPRTQCLALRLGLVELWIWVPPLSHSIIIPTLKAEFITPRSKPSTGIHCMSSFPPPYLLL